MNPRPITVWSKHPENYEFLALDFESSRYLTTSAADNTVILQNINTCKLIQTYRGHKGKVLHARFSQDGSRVLTTSEDKTAIIWDVAHGREIAKLVGHQDAVIFGTFSPDGKRVITQSNDKTLRIWDAFNGQAIATLSGYPGEIESPMFSPDGTRIIVDTFRYEDSNNSDNQIWTAWLWDAGTGVVVGSVDGHTAPSAFSPDGTQVITISKDSRFCQWNLVSGRSSVNTESMISCSEKIATNSDGTRIVFCGGQNMGLRREDYSDDQRQAFCEKKYLLDTSTNRPISDSLLAADGPNEPHFSHDGKWLVLKGSALWARFISNMDYILDIHFTAMPAPELLHEACLRRLVGATKLTRDEMRLAGYPDDSPEIDVCEGVQ
jgi:WD40 repeat protein